MINTNMRRSLLLRVSSKKVKNLASNMTLPTSKSARKAASWTTTLSTAWSTKSLQSSTMPNALPGPSDSLLAPQLPLQVDHAPKKTPHASAPPAANPPSSTRDRKPMGCPYPGCASQDHTKRHQATHTLECWIDGCQDRNKPFKDTSGIARHLIAMHNNNDSHNCRWNGCEKAKNQLTNHISLHLREHNWELEQAVAKSTQNEDAGDDDESVDADEDQQSYNSRIKKTGGKSRD
ncbi:hypothetical protein BKA67DRAFT_574741 [Truncatella angustata]|uniref:C2H2-type domain-containing protein n=1 Tax=Truncatella angustata TaxID=152316 RepID=A0A9P8UEF4_9PEZI|nr:uncharacterized protein BKA67DRAFT_574741 [Truncatella angustata]KAH6648416.1 hypothetical protein BKA67DRAFT_574741 [Truncatella angustata]